MLGAAVSTPGGSVSVHSLSCPDALSLGLWEVVCGSVLEFAPHVLLRHQWSVAVLEHCTELCAATCDVLIVLMHTCV